MLISKLFYFLLYVHPVLRKTTKHDATIWIFRTHSGNVFGLLLAHGHHIMKHSVLWQEITRKSTMLWRPLWWLSVVTRLWHCVNWRGRLHSSLCWQSFWCSTNRPLKKCNSNLGPRKRQKSALTRLLACFHPATKILSIAVNPYIAANEM